MRASSTPSSSLSRMLPRPYTPSFTAPPLTADRYHRARQRAHQLALHSAVASSVVSRAPFRLLVLSAVRSPPVSDRVTAQRRHPFPQYRYRRPHDCQTFPVHSYAHVASSTHSGRALGTTVRHPSHPCGSCGSCTPPSPGPSAPMGMPTCRTCQTSPDHSESLRAPSTHLVQAR